MAGWKFGQESGSGKETKIVLVTRVMKEATEERLEKLVDEINFLEKVPQKWKQHFPQIIFAEKKGSRVYYEMPHYPYPTLRKLIFTQTISKSEVLDWLNRILNFYFSMINEKKVSVPKSYMKTTHADRVRRRLSELSRKSNVFRELLLKEKITINGDNYTNIPFICKKLLCNKILSKCEPPYLSPWTHSDTHFSNIMIDVEHDNFILLDPRGYKKCDYYYDFGKLWHSVNGKYEMIAEKRFMHNDDSFMLKKEPPHTFLDNLKGGLTQLLLEYSIEDCESTMMKTEFNEAVHFASLIPFLLDYDGQEERALAAYYMATKLMNNFYDRWLVQK